MKRSIVLRNIRMNDMTERPLVWENPLTAGLPSINPAPALTAIFVYNNVKDVQIVPAMARVVLVYRS